MGDLWGIGGFGGGGGVGLEGANHKKKIANWKISKIGKKSENNFSIGNGLKSIGNSKKFLLKAEN